MGLAVLNSFMQDLFVRYCSHHFVRNDFRALMDNFFKPVNIFALLTAIFTAVMSVELIWLNFMLTAMGTYAFPFSEPWPSEFSGTMSLELFLWPGGGGKAEGGNIT